MFHVSFVIPFLVPSAYTIGIFKTMELTLIRNSIVAVELPPSDVILVVTSRG